MTCQEQNRNISQVSVIIPVRNGAATLARCLHAVAGAAEIIVVDGGSDDETATIAQAFGAKLLHAPPGRGGQLRAGVAVAAKPFLLLLHADTILAPGWAEMLDPLRAGYFALRFDSANPAARRLEAMVAWRCRWLALPYGDQGLLISAKLLAGIGGVPDLALMEDVALARRLGRGRLRALPQTALTSAARYERTGYLARSARNLFCLALYVLGCPVSVIKRIYG